MQAQQSSSPRPKRVRLVDFVLPDARKEITLQGNGMTGNRRRGSITGRLEFLLDEKVNTRN